MKNLCIFLILLSLFLVHDPVRAKTEAMEPLRIAFLADLHYIAPELTDHGSLFTQITENADGKITRYCEEITDAFIEQLLRNPVDALILPGDLTFNGAVQSHAVLAEKLLRLRDAGIPVFVIPGNHDLFNNNAARFDNTRFTRIESADAFQFRRIWSSFGYDQALSCAPDSLSYVLDLPGNIRLLMIDVNTEDHIGILTEATYNWICRQLDAADNDDRRVLAISHQTLLTHNPLFTDSFKLTGAEKLITLYETHHVLCNISGHMHIQHFLRHSAVPEIVVSSAAVAPNQYGILTLYQDQAEYHTELIDVTGWAKRHDINNPELVNFSQYTTAFFAGTTVRQAAVFLEKLPPESKQALTLYLINLNAAYFRGNLTDFSASDPEYLSLTETMDFWSLYLSTIHPDLSMDYTSFHFSFGGNTN